MTTRQRHANQSRTIKKGLWTCVRSFIVCKHFRAAETMMCICAARIARGESCATREYAFARHRPRCEISKALWFLCKAPFLRTGARDDGLPWSAPRTRCLVAVHRIRLHGFAAPTRASEASQL